ncbi:MAG: hypothetical protein GXP48_05520 [Acidobacteria bacterium]|nr:hypothetical protein [Acidobacteriota bacterium]
MTAAASLVLTLLLGLGLVGLGRAVGARSLPLAWVVGWTVLWWITALAATVAGPRFGAGTGLVAAGAGLVVWALRSQRRRWELLLGTGAVLAGAPFFLAPPYFYDALVYHLGLPWSWLANGSFAPVTHNLFSHFPLAGETVYLLPVSLGLPRAAAGLHWLTFVLVLVAAWELARRLGAQGWAWIAPLCLVACWHAVWVAGVAGVDHLVVLAIVVAAIELIGTGDEGVKVLSGGVALGLALATKYVAVIPAGAVLAGAVVSSPTRWRDAVKAGLLGAGLASFWYLRNLLLTGNPVYPLLWKVFGGTGWTARDAARWNGLVHEGVGGLGSFWNGLVKLGSSGAGLGPWLAIAVVLAVVALVRGRRRRAIEGVAVAAVLIVGGWLATAHTTRYALPLIPLAGALAAAGVERLSRGARRVAVAGLLLAAGFGLVLFGQFIAGTLHMPEMWFGRVSSEGWRHRVTLNDPMPGYRAAGRLLPPGAKLLVIGEGRSWGCPRPNSVSSPYDTQLVQTVIEDAATAADAARTLHAAGWNDLFINWRELRRLHRKFGVFVFRDPADGARWRELIDGFTTRIWHSDGLEIRRLVSLPPAGGRESAARP